MNCNSRLSDCKTFQTRAASRGLAASRGRLRRIQLATSIIGKDSGIPSALPAHQPRGVRAGSWFVVGADERELDAAKPPTVNGPALHDAHVPRAETRRGRR